MEAFIENLPYLGLVVVLTLSGFGMPIPEDVPLIFAGYLCGQGHADIYIMLPLAFVTVIGTDMIIYTFGRKLGHRIPNLPIIRRFLTQSRLAQAAEFFHRHGGKTLFFGRFLPGIRTPIFFTAGTFKIPWWKMLLFDGAAALLSVPALVLLAYYFSDHIEAVRRWVLQAQIGIILIIALAIVGTIGWYWMKRRRAKAAG